MPVQKKSGNLLLAPRIYSAVFLLDIFHWKTQKTYFLIFLLIPSSCRLVSSSADGNYTRMLRAILNKSWRQHPTRHQLYGHLPPITKTIQVRRTRHAGHCWRSKDELISDLLLWTPAYGQAKAGRPARTYIQHLCEDTGCNHEDLPKAMNDREKWRERVWDVRGGGTTWWWWWLIPEVDFKFIWAFYENFSTDFSTTFDYLIYLFYYRSSYLSICIFLYFYISLYLSQLVYVCQSFYLSHFINVRGAYDRFPDFFHTGI